MKRIVFLSLLTAAAAGLTSCNNDSKSGSKAKIKTSGSTTLAPIVGAWAEEYKPADVIVGQGGSGQGIKDLIAGLVDIANSSRAMTPDEKAQLKEKTGKDAYEIHVGYDALAIYTSQSNPLKEISIEQLNGIYSSTAAAPIRKWEEIPGSGLTGDIRVLGREEGSGTADYLQEAVNGKGADGKAIKFREGISGMASSQAVIDTLGSTANAIAYDGMAFKTDKVHWLAVSKKAGEPAVLPAVDDARSGKYPLARKLFLYTAGEPTGEVKKFVDWVLSAEGQKVLADSHAVTLK